MQENNQTNPVPKDDNLLDDEVFIDSISDIDFSDPPITSDGDTINPDLAADIDGSEVILEKDPDESIDQGTLTPIKPDDSVDEIKTRRFFRKFFRWSAGVLIIFGLGLITGIFLLYRPATQEASRSISIAETDLSSAQAQIYELESKITALETQIDTLQPLKENNLALLSTQDDLNLHISILDARVDVTSALLALSQDDNARARVLLNKTSDTLEQISGMLEPKQQDIATAMKQRLELVMDEIEDDPYAAQSDLDVLATNLLQLEDALISK